ncbi:MAG TPA: hypothetical protein VGO50_20085 [Pyrinomonadaceae bacterium]|jgi:hypothetical protein|nr:hypothetical protein [Pyrinomonadaceae bacterium]
MKNSNALSLVLCIGILIVIGCSCPQMAEIQKEIDKAGKTTPSPTTSSTPAKTSSDDSELTLEKFNQIKNGMTYDECVEIIGSEGNQTVSSGEGKYKFESYKWDGPNYQFIMLSFMGGKLNSKAQNGLK